MGDFPGILFWVMLPRAQHAPPPKPHESIQAELEEWRLRAEEQRPLAELLANSEKRLQDTDRFGKGDGWDSRKGPEVPKKWECRIFWEMPQRKWDYIYHISTCLTEVVFFDFP